MIYTFAASPIGDLLLAGDHQGLHWLIFPEGPKSREPNSEWRLQESAFPEARRQLDAYFSGTRRTFPFPFMPHGTPFQIQHLNDLVKIPYGHTTTYQALAERLGKPNAARAIGAANARNPLPIIIPCHRVLGSSGALTGFGGGLRVKEFLLDLEQRHARSLSS